MFYGRISTKYFRQNDDIFCPGNLPQSAEALIITDKKEQRSSVIMPFDKDEMIQILIQTNKEQERFCPDCSSPMEHPGYKFVREELRITL